LSAVGDAYEFARAEISNIAAEILPDVCTFSKPESAGRHSYGYSTEGSPTTVPDIPCELQPLSAYEQLAGGQTTAGANGKLKVPANVTTLVINGGYTGTIAARGTSPAIEFTVVGPLRSSTDLWLFLAVTVG
jgi:hypothetical protein